MDTNIGQLKVGPWTFKLHYGSDIVDFDATSFKKAEAVQTTLTYIAEHQEEVQAALLKDIRAEYDKALDDSDAFDPEDLEEILPPIDTPEDLMALVTPRMANICETAKDNTHFVGFAFECTWDDEHGLGVLTYKNKAMRHGGADTAMLEWMAEEATEKL